MHRNRQRIGQEMQRIWEEYPMGKNDAQLREIVERAGAQWVGVQQSLDGKPEVVLFRDPVTGSTCALYPMACQSVEDVQAAMRRKRELFDAADASAAAATGAPKDAA